MGIENYILVHDLLTIETEILFLKMTIALNLNLDKANNNFDLLNTRESSNLEGPRDIQSTDLFYTVASFLISLAFLFGLISMDFLM